MNRHDSPTDKRSLSDLKFLFTALEQVPVEQRDDSPCVPRQVQAACFSPVQLQPVEEPQVVCVSEPALALIGVGITQQDWEPETAAMLSASVAISDSAPYAHCYAGHQFGMFAGQLGDGAATSIGEVLADQGNALCDVRFWELQFKGAGLTPYSRAGDGRKVLRSSLREFLASEAMHHLGVPTTRAASICTSGTTVLRDPNYSGKQIHEPAAIVLRMAPTFVRFGSFEICKTAERSNTGQPGPSAGQPGIVKKLADYVIWQHFPAAAGCSTLQDNLDCPAYVAFYQSVVELTARLLAEWQSVGFCHGVMNTDNMSILGLTLDYGPYAFLDGYDETFVGNTSDDSGRYAFGEQPEIALRNLDMLSEELSACLGVEKQLLDEASRKYWPCYRSHFRGIMQQKLGLTTSEGEADGKLIEGLLECMQKSGVDMHVTFRSLAMVPMPSAPAAIEALRTYEDFLSTVLATAASPKAMAARVKSRMDPRQLHMLQQLAAASPMALMSLGISEKAIKQEAAKNMKAAELASIDESKKLREDKQMWQRWLQAYSDRLGREHSAGTSRETRTHAMSSRNPTVVLRNWVAQVAIDAATRGDYNLVKRILGLLEEPFKDWSEQELLLPLAADGKGRTWRADRPPPPELASLKCSCSS